MQDRVLTKEIRNEADYGMRPATSIGARQPAGRRPGGSITICGSSNPETTSGNPIVLYTIAVVLIILWLLGMVTSTTMGGLIHALLVIAIIVVLLRVISGRNAV
jgi:Family of unknown function (DUF5670)